MSKHEAGSLSISPSAPRFCDQGHGSGGSGSDGHNIVVQRVVKKTGGIVVYPMLTLMNYGDWSLLMRVNL